MIQLDPIRRSMYALFGACWLIALGLGIAGCEYYLSQKAAMEKEQRTQLAAIAELKIRQIRDWRRERIADGRVVLATSLTPAVRAFLSGSGEPSKAVTDWLGGIRAAAGYANVILVNPTRKRWTSVGNPIHSQEEFFRLALDVMERDDVVLTDFHVDGGLTGAHLGLNIPMRLAPGTPPVGAMLIGIDPNTMLYPLIREWPTASRSAEALITRREGADVLSLSELRYRQDSALKFRVPVTKERLPEARGAGGFEGVMEGVDYRDVPVLAAVRRVPETRWILVAKVDLEELRAPIARQTFWLILIGCSVVLTIGTGVPLTIRELRARFELQRYQAELKENALRGQYDFLSRFANDIILLTSEEGRIVEANDRALKAYGYSREELIGKPLIELRAAEMRETFSGDWQRTEDQDSVIFETRHLRKDGSTLPVEVSSRRILVGRSVFRQSIIRDITERREAEKERAHLQEQLQQAQKLESIGRLAGGIAHDFNNLLTVINGYSNMLMAELPPEDSSRELLGEIYEAGQRAANLTRQLLAFSRKQVVTPKIVNLNTVVADVAKMLRRLVGEDVEVEVDLVEPLWSVYIDAGQVEQMLMNLATNARDAMPEGGVFRIESLNVEIGEKDAASHLDGRPGRFVQLAVSDTGQGMSEETLKHAFEPFFTTKPRGRGTGLGLASVHGAVKQNNGWIEAFSQVGKGTRFEIYLPKRDAVAGAGDANGQPGETTSLRGTETVLVVEDQAEVRKLAVDALRRYGYHVLQAANGDEALRWFARDGGHVDLLVTDVVMPGLSGPEVARRAVSISPQLKVMYMSGYTEDLMAHQSILSSGISYLQKPFTPTALAHKVRETLELPN